jgi:hypothetical protein
LPSKSKGLLYYARLLLTGVIPKRAVLSESRDLSSCEHFARGLLTCHPDRSVLSVAHATLSEVEGSAFGFCRRKAKGFSITHAFY